MNSGPEPARGGPAISQAGERRSVRIESLRALAALSVLAGHIALFSIVLAPGETGFADLSTFEELVFGGGYGVLFFFGLTGYLLFWPFATRYFGNGTPIDLGTYALNRALRILPLYFVVVIAVLAFQEQPPATWLRFLTFTENFSAATAGQVVGPAWSLVVELHFYILLPALAWGLARLTGGSLTRAAWVLAAAAAALLAVRALTVYGPQLADPVWRYSPPATFLFFIPGMLLALLRLRWAGGPPAWLRGPLRRADLWLASSIPLWLIVALGSYDLDFLLFAASFLMVGACVLPLEAGPLTAALEWRPLAIVGVASYSLYLWHLPLLEVLVDAGAPTGMVTLALVAVPAAIATALLSYRAIEAPFLRLRGQWARTSAPQERSSGDPAADRARQAEAA